MLFGTYQAESQLAAAGAERPRAGHGASAWLTFIPPMKPRTCTFVDVMNQRARWLQESSQ